MAGSSIGCVCCLLLQCSPLLLLCDMTSEQCRHQMLLDRRRSELRGEKSGVRLGLGWWRLMLVVQVLLIELLLGVEQTEVGCRAVDKGL